MSREVEFNSLSTKDDVKIQLEQPKGPRKPSDEEIAQYGKLRMALVIFFGIVIIAMVVAAVIIIIVSPQCTKAKAELSKSWIQDGAVVYHIYPRSFKDSDKDGNGDLKGIQEKLGYFKDLGVKIIRLGSIYASPQNGNGVSNFTQVNPMYGNLKDFDSLVEKAHEHGIKIIMDFIPNHTSDKHPWFVESKKSASNPKRSWYVWKDGKSGGPPNNWLSVYGGSAWEKDSTTGHYYLHQFYKDQPDLNLTNPQVRNALKEVLKFWLDKGVDGFNMRDTQYLVEDSAFRDEVGKAGYNSSDPKYDLLQHERTIGLVESVVIVKEFKDFMDEKYSDSYRALIAEVQVPDNKYYNSSDFPSNMQLITAVGKQNTAAAVNQSIVGYLGSLPEKATPNWVLGTAGKARVGTRLGENLIDAMNVLMLTLPGTAVTYYGEEIGMTGDPATSPMQWSDEVLAGFSGSSKPWSPVASNYKTINVETESKAEGQSTLKIYKKLTELRSEAAMSSLAFKIVQADDKVFAYTRGEGEKSYLVIINFSNAEWDGDIALLSGTGVVSLDTKKADNSELVDVNKLKLAVGQAMVIKMI